MSERDAIVSAIHSTPNLGEAAKKLGASRRALQLHMRANGIPPGKPGRPRTALPFSKRHGIGGASADEWLVLVGVAAGAFLLGRYLLSKKSSTHVVGSDNPYLVGMRAMAAR